MNEFDTRCEMLTKKMRAALIKSAVLYMIYMDEEEIKTIAQLLESARSALSCKLAVAPRTASAQVNKSINLFNTKLVNKMVIFLSSN